MMRKSCKIIKKIPKLAPFSLKNVRMSNVHFIQPTERSTPMNYSACTSILIGAQATTDGSVMIGGNEDAKAAWPKHFVVHPAHTVTTPQRFVSTDNGFTMPLPLSAAKYTATPEWPDKYGLFEEDGINAFGVAMSATESTYSNERVLGADPLVKDGIGEEAMVTVVLPYVQTARAGVARLGQIVE